MSMAARIRFLLRKNGGNPTFKIMNSLAKSIIPLGGQSNCDHVTRFHHRNFTGSRNYTKQHSTCSNWYSPVSRPDDMNPYSRGNFPSKSYIDTSSSLLYPYIHNSSDPKEEEDPKYGPVVICDLNTNNDDDAYRVNFAAQFAVSVINQVWLAERENNTKLVRVTGESKYDIRLVTGTGESKEDIRLVRVMGESKDIKLVRVLGAYLRSGPKNRMNYFMTLETQVRKGGEGDYKRKLWRAHVIDHDAKVEQQCHILWDWFEWAPSCSVEDATIDDYIPCMT